jgi:hypothetical protein
MVAFDGFFSTCSLVKSQKPGVPACPVSTKNSLRRTSSDETSHFCSALHHSPDLIRHSGLHHNHRDGIAVSSEPGGGEAELGAAGRNSKNTVTSARPKGPIRVTMGAQSGDFPSSSCHPCQAHAQSALVLWGKDGVLRI